MTYLQARCIAIVKRILGWLIFIPALLSTFTSIINFIYGYSKALDRLASSESQEFFLVLKDFIRVFLEMVKNYTGALDYFWHSSPLPTLGTGWSANNVGFLSVYWLMFIGLALAASGERMMRQTRNVKQLLEDLAIVEQAKEAPGLDYQQLIKRAKFKYHTIFTQYFQLYFLPFIIIGCVYFLMITLQKIGF